MCPAGADAPNSRFWEAAASPAALVHGIPTGGYFACWAGCGGFGTDPDVSVPVSAIMGYHKEVVMTDVLIRDVPDEVIAIVDAHAARLGISRSEYVRRRLAQDAAGASKVSVADLKRFAEDFGDLADPGVMAQAWR